MLDGKAWLLVSTLIHPKGVLLGWGLDSVQASQVRPHQTLSSMSLWTLLCALVCSHVGTGRGHPHKVWSMELPNLSLYAETFKVPFTRAKGPSQQPHTTVPLHQSLHLANTELRLVHQIARWRSTIGHSRERVSTALESSGGMLYTTASNALHCTCWCMAWQSACLRSCFRHLWPWKWWNTWFKLFGWVSEYFWKYSVLGTF